MNRLHLLVDVIVLSICGVLAGADGPTGIEEWAVLNQEWLVKYLKLPNGVPSHDTIGRVLRALGPRVFQECSADSDNAFRISSGIMTTHNMIAV